MGSEEGVLMGARFVEEDGMSHRRRPTIADRTIDGILGDFPELRDIDHVIDAAGEEAFGMCGELMRLTEDMYNGKADDDALMRMDTAGMLRPDLVALWSRWRQCRHVYRFDKGLSEALSETKSPEDMPTDALRRLPYPVSFVEARLPYGTVGCDTLWMRGFFVWAEDDAVVIVSVFDDRLASLSIFTDGKTLGEAVDKVVWADRMAWRNYGGLKSEEEQRESVRSTFMPIIAHLLYIVSENSEQEVVYRPSGRANPRKASPSTIHEVGTRIGRRLGQARVRYVGVGSDGSSGSSVRPHVRSAHWHHYWTGSMSEPESRRLVVRWLEPIFVNAGGRETETVVHEAS